MHILLPEDTLLMSCSSVPSLTPCVSEEGHEPLYQLCVVWSWCPPVWGKYSAKLRWITLTCVEPLPFRQAVTITGKK